MATSGSVDFSVTATDIILAALRKLKIVKDDVPKAYSKHVVPALQELNMLVKSWAGDGLRMWKRELVKVDLLTNKNRYTVGTYGSNIYRIKQPTEIMTAGVATDTSIYVKGVSTQFTVGDVIEIHQDDGTILTTTIASGVATSGSGVTFVITDALTDGVAAGAQVTTYALDTRVFDRVLAAHRRSESWSDNSSSTSDIPIDVVSKEFYNARNNKRSDGPTQYVYFDRLLDAGYLYIWPEASDTDQHVYLTVHMPVEDFDSLTDSPDFPKEWYLALVYNLAYILADNYENIDPNTLASISSKADQFYGIAAQNDSEEGSWFFQPDYRFNRS